MVLKFHGRHCKVVLWDIIKRKKECVDCSLLADKCLFIMKALCTWELGLEMFTHLIVSVYFISYHNDYHINNIFLFCMIFLYIILTSSLIIQFLYWHKA